MHLTHFLLLLSFFAQCTTLTSADESRASTTARTPLAPASLRCICPTMAREELSTSKSLLRRTPPTSTPTSSTPTTPLPRTKPPSTRTASSTWASVCARCFSSCVRVGLPGFITCFSFCVTRRTRCLPDTQPDERHGGRAPGGRSQHLRRPRRRPSSASPGAGGLHRQQHAAGGAGHSDRRPRPLCRDPRLRLLPQHRCIGPRTGCGVEGKVTGAFRPVEVVYPKRRLQGGEFRSGRTQQKLASLFLSFSFF